MTPEMIGIIGLVILFALLFIGIPVGVSLGLVAIAGLWVLLGDTATLLKMAITPFRMVESYDLSVLPLFLLMADVCAATGVSRDLYDLAAKWVGRLPGGIAMASIGACAIFAAISSSAVACAATIGSIAIPEMRRFNYDDSLATGTVAAGGTIGILIPPSFMFVLYGILTETSIGKLFMAGFIPGVLQAIFYFIAIYIVCKRNPSIGPRGPATTLKEKIMAFGSCGEVIGLILLVLVGITVGWFTPTEAGSIGAGGAILITLIRRRLTWQNFIQACMSSMKTTGMVFLILVGAYLFTYFITVTNIPMALSNMITGMGVSPMAVVWIIIGTYIFLGTAMEEASMMLLTIPIFTPIIMNLGFDKIWFGVLVVRMMQVAMISPPVGITLFVIKGIAKDVPMGTIYKGVIPFIIADVIHVTLVVFIPGLSMFLPSLMR
jgi:tripartite ATP-independent transporter DctM subunit